MEQQSNCDVLIAGGGLAGALAAAHLARIRPDIQILLLEKDPGLGGRLRAGSSEARMWSYGLSGVGPRLYQYWDQTLKLDPEGRDLPEFTTGRLEQIGILSKGEFKNVAASQLFAKEGARALGGGVAAKDWTLMDELFADANPHHKQGFGQVFTGGKKSASAAVLERLCFALGIPDLWSANAEAIAARAMSIKEAPFLGDWTNALDEMLAPLGRQIKIETNCRILNAHRDSDYGWSIDTEKGLFHAGSLVVAQPPWDALFWLPKNEWPTDLLNVVAKTKPVSVVVLTAPVKAASAGSDLLDLPASLIVPTEDVQVIFDKTRSELILQVTLDYELSLQAPAVVKSLRRLRRAKRKIAKACQLEFDENEHFALLPVGWSQSPAQVDRRYMDRLGQIEWNSADLCFCGDSYGPSYDGDSNVVHSVPRVIEKLGNPSRSKR